MTAHATLPYATPKQVALINKLVAEGRGQVTNPSMLSVKEASAAIDQLLKAPAPTFAGVTEVGMYRNPAGDIFKVQASKQTGNLYAKRLVAINGQRLSEEWSVVQWEFQYDAGAVRSLTPAMRLTLDEAKAFGIQFGVCCVCGATLKDATSVANGIGPVCATRL